MPSVPSDDAVVKLSANGIACSAALIAPDVVVTALHCVSEFDLDKSFSCQSDGTLTTGSSGGTLGPLVEASSVQIFSGVEANPTGISGKAIYGTKSPVVCRDDFAIVVLDGNVPVDVPPVSLRFGGSTKGEPVRAVGYGLTDSTASGRNERDGLTILGVGSPNSVIKGDPNVAPRTLMVGEGPCHGDSGGPLFSVATGAEIGVYSLLSTTSCEGPDVRNIFTQIAPYEDLIRMALSTVGEEPIVEVTPETGAGGEGGMTGQAGEPSVAGAPGDAGASPEPTGGSTGGLGGSGGSGAVGGSGPASGGNAAMGDDTQAEAGAQSEGSGSRRDPSCACRTGRASDPSDPAPWPLLGLSFAALTLLRRRRSVRAS
jgi:MYXO-CTERM domain-containing protein